ncbi:MAG: hypothetical protein ABIH25_05700 [Candidatus Woesearchaeota archaeon]
MKKNIEQIKQSMIKFIVNNKKPTFHKLKEHLNDKGNEFIGFPNLNLYLCGNVSKEFKQSFWELLDERRIFFRKCNLKKHEKGNDKIKLIKYKGKHYRNQQGATYSKPRWLPVVIEPIDRLNLKKPEKNFAWNILIKEKVRS